MSTYVATVRWERGGAQFTDNRYSRLHWWDFDGGTTVPGSASPHTVPLPYSDASAVDPEEAFVAALASCHMLFFLSIAARRGFRVESYRDEATGSLTTNADGMLSMTSVALRPHATFVGDSVPDGEAVNRMHQEAHHECFIANSVKTELTTAWSFDAKTGDNLANSGR